MPDSATNRSGISRVRQVTQPSVAASENSRSRRHDVHATARSLDPNRPLAQSGWLERLGPDALYELWQKCHAELAATATAHQPLATNLDAAAVYQRLVAPSFAPGAGQTVSLIIPAWREGHRIERSVALVQKFLREFPLASEVIYVVEASDDGTLERARSAAAGQDAIKVHDNRIQRGKGYAVQCGMRMACGDITFYNDTDLAVPLHQMLLALAVFAERPDTDVLIGERHRLSDRSLARRFMTRAYRLAITSIAGLPSGWDPQCGFKAFRRAAGDELFSRQTLHGFAFDVELLLLARERGLNVLSQPVPWLNDERSTVRPVADFFSMTRELAGLKSSRAAPERPAETPAVDLAARPAAEQRGGGSQ